MKGKRLAGIGSSNDNEGGERVAFEDLEGKPALGDVIWVKLDNGSWWPAVVVDENNVSASTELGDRSMEDVLVRLYGSCECTYVDPIKSRSEFVTILKLKNGCYHEILKDSLEHDISHSETGQSEREGSKSEVAFTKEVDPSKQKKSEQYPLNQRKVGRTNRRAGTGKAASVRLNRSKEIAGRNSTCDIELVRVSPKKKLTKITSERKMENGNLLSEDVKEEISIASKQDGPKRKLKLDSPDMEENSKRLTSKRGRMLEKPKQDPSSRTSSRAIDGVKGRSSKQGVKEEPAPTVNARNKTPKQDVAQKKQKLNVNVTDTPLLGRSQELSTRRTKVMQTLGLIAPSGSPFHRKRHFHRSV